MAFPGVNKQDFDTVHVVNRRPLMARVDTHPIIIINIRLATLPFEGSPAHLVHTALLPYYPGKARDHLLLVDAPYDVKDLDDAEVYRRSFTPLLDYVLQ